MFNNILVLVAVVVVITKVIYLIKEEIVRNNMDNLNERYVDKKTLAMPLGKKNYVINVYRAKFKYFVRAKERSYSSDSWGFTKILVVSISHPETGCHKEYNIRAERFGCSRVPLSLAEKFAINAWNDMDYNSIYEVLLRTGIMEELGIAIDDKKSKKSLQ